MDSWDPAQYGRFADERAQPFWDLLALAPTGPVRRGVDLGCGTGELTAAAAERLAVADMCGIDTSSAMLARATELARDGLRFEFGDIATWTSPADHDLVLANASLHWVGDHPAVLARWVAALRNGGWLAVQVPANADHPSHLASAAVAHREPFVSAFGPDGPPADPVAANVLRPEHYAEVLYGLGIAEPHVRLQVYPHVLSGVDAVVEWTRGTSLTRFSTRLPVDLHEPFVEAYRRELVASVGTQRPYLFAFKRILMAGRSSV